MKDKLTANKVANSSPEELPVEFSEEDIETMEPVDYERVAELTEGMVASELETLVEDIAREAMLEREPIGMKHVETALKNSQ
jgi:SpoVK/Ycf46/Vps4 family AAA+-type ATPase